MMRFLLSMLIVLWAAPAYADCSSPAGKRGALMYNDTYDVVQVCTGINWYALGGDGGSGVPAGAVMAFDLANCPAGWTAYAASSGRFLRGRCLSGEPCNDPDGTRSAGSTQADAFQGHHHTVVMTAAPSQPRIVAYNPGNYPEQSAPNNGGAQWSGLQARTPISDGTNGTPRIAAETRPKNVAVLYCRKN